MIGTPEELETAAGMALPASHAMRGMFAIELIRRHRNIASGKTPATPPMPNHVGGDRKLLDRPWYFSGSALEDQPNGSTVTLKTQLFIATPEQVERVMGLSVARSIRKGVFAILNRLLEIMP